MGEKISDSDKEAINSKCDEIIKWLDANQLAEVDEFQDKQKEVEGICNPIITKLYQAAGGAPGVCQEACPEECQEVCPVVCQEQEVQVQVPVGQEDQQLKKLIKLQVY